MQPPSERAVAGRTRLAAALLDYRHHPGRYSIGRREPAILFASIPEVLQLAAGKSAHDEPAALQPHAAFFVRTALIYPGADHYTLLGLERASDAARIKAHYRLMMRLVHPDFAAGPGADWPSDAATRLNLAYEVLGSPARRARYDEEISPPAAATRPAPRPAPHARQPIASAPKPPATEPRVLVKWLAGGFGVLGALGVVALVVASGGDPEHLIRGTPLSRTAVLPLLLETPGIDPLPDATEMPAAPPGRIGMVPPAPTSAPRIAAASGHPAAVQPEPVRVEHAPPAPAPAAPPVAIASPAVAPPPAIAPAVPAAAAPVAVKPNPGVTLAQVQPLLAALIQQLESGRGDRVLSLLERDARNTPAARALSRQLDGLVDGAQPVTLSNVEFRAEPAEGRLFVTGHVRFHAGDPGTAVKRLGLRAEFMARDGAVVMTGLSGLGEN